MSGNKNNLIDPNKNLMPNLKPFLYLTLLCLFAAPLNLWAQATPRLNSLFPAGAQVGNTV
ncbi:hypothetical protein F4083_02540 [Candidatus Poribacteria bacterium]|nr:hypothetical protein [Candidatus Poribacteria bacterium]